MEINIETIHDIQYLLDEGVDDYWWTLKPNYSIINKLRKTFGLEEISEDYLDYRQKYWKDL
jgi:hypothetical protein